MKCKIKRNTSLMSVLIFVALMSGCFKSNNQGATATITPVESPTSTSTVPDTSPTLAPSGTAEETVNPVGDTRLIRNQADLQKVDRIEINDEITGEVKRYSDSKLLKDWIRKIGDQLIPVESLDMPTPEERFFVQLFTGQESLLYLSVNVPRNSQPTADRELGQIVKELFTLPGDLPLLAEDCKNSTTDLNGDGKKDTITFCGAAGANEFTIQVNKAHYTSYADNLTGLFKLVNINKSDQYREIAVSEDGPSSDPRTYFLSYTEDEKLILLGGKIPGYGEDIYYNGDGSLITSMYRGKILQTWFYPKTFKQDDDRLLQPIDEEIYPMSTPVTLRQELTLYNKKNSSIPAFTVFPGDKAMIVASDDIAWCQIQTEGGKLGWFEVEEFDRIKGTKWNSSDVFEGLSFAD